MNTDISLSGSSEREIGRPAPCRSAGADIASQRAVYSHVAPPEPNPSIGGDAKRQRWRTTRGGSVVASTSHTSATATAVAAALALQMEGIWPILPCFLGGAP